MKHHNATSLCFLLFIVIGSAYGQHDTGLFSRLHGISNNGVDFYNVDGIEIISRPVDATFSPKNISKKFRQLSIKEKELITSDSGLAVRNYYLFRSEERSKGLFSNTAYYFIENADQTITGIIFSSINKKDKAFERQFVKLIMDNAIPKSVFSPMNIDSINFAGRKIALGGACQWRGINNVQCPYYGQMNWSVHKDLDDAWQTVDHQFVSIKSGKHGKIVSDTTVNIIFEGTKGTAKKIVYDFTGVTSALASMSGGKTLTVYFVASPVRNNFVSCVMSFWNNDQINPGGLPPLLEKVMNLE